MTLQEALILRQSFRDQVVECIVKERQFSHGIASAGSLLRQAGITLELLPLRSDLSLGSGRSGCVNSWTVLKTEGQSSGQFHRIDQVADTDRDQSLDVEIHISDATFER